MLIVYYISEQAAILLSLLCVDNDTMSDVDIFSLETQMEALVNEREQQIATVKASFSHQIKALSQEIAIEERRLRESFLRDYLQCAFKAMADDPDLFVLGPDRDREYEATMPADSILGLGAVSQMVLQFQYRRGGDSLLYGIPYGYGPRFILWAKLAKQHSNGQVFWRHRLIHGFNLKQTVPQSEIRAKARELSTHTFPSFPGKWRM